MTTESKDKTAKSVKKSGSEKSGAVMATSKKDLKDIIAQAQKSFKDPRMKNKLSTAAELQSISNNPDDYIRLPEWYKEAYGVPGIQFGKSVVWAGPSDSGKTSFCIEVMRAAQQQGVQVIYVETELKTTLEDLTNAGIDTDLVALAQSAIIEEAWELMFAMWDAIHANDPTTRVLVVFDSLGNTVSQHDKEINMMEQNSKVGGSAKTNRLGMNKLVAIAQERNAALLVISRTYANLNAPGKTVAGGQALAFFATVVTETTRVGWITGTTQGVTIRKGAEVEWRIRKNHYAKALKTADGKPLPLPEKTRFTITEKGIQRKGKAIVSAESAGDEEEQMEGSIDEAEEE
jgi:RecA/RadA recombinase